MRAKSSYSLQTQIHFELLLTPERKARGILSYAGALGVEKIPFRPEHPPKSREFALHISPLKVRHSTTDAGTVLPSLPLHYVSRHFGDARGCLVPAVVLVLGVVYPNEVTVVPDSIPEFVFGFRDFSF
jgi:hypothetical protein